MVSLAGDGCLSCAYTNPIKWYTWDTDFPQWKSNNSQLRPRIIHVYAWIPTQSASPQTHRARLPRLASGNGSCCWWSQWWDYHLEGIQDGIFWSQDLGSGVVVYGSESVYGVDWKLFPVSIDYLIIRAWDIVIDLISRSLVKTLGYNKNITLRPTAPPYVHRSSHGEPPISAM